jgi:hypothetical protein
LTFIWKYLLQHDPQSMPSTTKLAYSSAPSPTINHYTSELQYNDSTCIVPMPSSTNIPFSVPVILCIFLSLACSRNPTPYHNLGATGANQRGRTGEKCNTFQLVGMSIRFNQTPCIVEFRLHGDVLSFLFFDVLRSENLQFRFFERWLRVCCICVD